MGFLKKLFGDYSAKEVKRVLPLRDKVLALEETYAAKTDEELQAVTPALRERLANGETLDDILPDAFAACREASWRVLGMKHFPVQVVGGIILHQGRIAEMKTGEGKTLVATLPAYLNALSGKGVHVVTVNDYLARRDSEWMGKVYRFLGLKVGLIVHEKNDAERREAYAADITYGTNNEMGFDYLRDNMVPYKELKVQRGHNFGIVDEVDSILIDEARTPLIISGKGDASTDLYRQANEFAKRLKVVRIKEQDTKKNAEEEADADYIVDEKAKTAVLTKEGVKKAEAYFHVDNLMDLDNVTVQHHINMAIRAQGVMKRDVDYVVKDGQVLIVDEFTGRIMLGRRYSEGLHQAIEAKEGVKVESENKTLATITFQNYFRLYEKLSGMTGTAMTESEEFQEIYKLDAVEIPTNKPMVRDDHPDAVYATTEAKYKAVIDQIEECHKKGQPVLVGTISIEKSELLSAMLKKRRIKHEVLNAKYHEKEAEIIAQAGKFGAVTIATNMAGRGTDIMLGGNSEYLAKAEMRRMQIREELISEATGFAETDDQEILDARRTFTELDKKYKEEIAEEAEKVRQAGGLFIIGTERHESRRIDNQLRGRSGRQGDVGVSIFFISLEDDLMVRFGGERMKRIYEMSKMQDDESLESKLLTNLIEYAQKQIEGRNFGIRKNVLQYDDVMNKQRTIMYAERMRVIRGENVHEQVLKYIPGYVEGVVREAVNADDMPEKWSEADLNAALERYLIPEGSNYVTREKLEKWDYDIALKRISEKTTKCYEEKIARIKEEMPAVDFGKIERDVLLSYVNSNWIDHIDAMDQLRKGITLRAYGQTDPVIAYKQEGFAMFDEMVERIQERTIRFLLKCQIRAQQRPVQRIFPTANRPAQPAQNSQEPVQPRQPEQQEAPVQNNAPEATQSVQNAAPVGPEAMPKEVDVNSLRTSGEVKFNPATMKKDKKVGPNDPCPCGSGLKYKKCHGKPY